MAVDVVDATGESALTTLTPSKVRDPQGSLLEQVDDPALLEGARATGYGVLDVPHDVPKLPVTPHPRAP